jgi:hypothetical protein
VLLSPNRAGHGQLSGVPSLGIRLASKRCPGLPGAGSSRYLYTGENMKKLFGSLLLAMFLCVSGGAYATAAQDAPKKCDDMKKDKKAKKDKKLDKKKKEEKKDDKKPS